MADEAAPSKRDIATGVIAQQLGIPPSQVSDDTELGDHGLDIVTVVCFKTCTALVGRVGMKAKDVFNQL